MIPYHLNRSFGSVLHNTTKCLRELDTILTVRVELLEQAPKTSLSVPIPFSICRS